MLWLAILNLALAGLMTVAPVVTKAIVDDVIAAKQVVLLPGYIALIRRTGGTAQLVGELTLHLEWFRAYCSFVRPHNGLRQTLEIPWSQVQVSSVHSGQCAASRGMMVGIASQRWTVLELKGV